MKHKINRKIVFIILMIFYFTLAALTTALCLYSLLGSPSGAMRIVQIVVVSTFIFCSLAFGVAVFIKTGMLDKEIVRQHDEIEGIRMNAEAEVATSRAKADFIANMSHEIRTPMNAICCATELLMKEDIPGSGRSYLGILKSSSENLLDIVNDILDFSKIDAGRMTLVENEYEISSLIGDVENIISVRLNQKPIAFTVDIDPTMPHTMIGDEVRIRQILINLIGNSVKFTAKGLIALDVTYERLSKETIDVSFAVRDTGSGIAPSEKEKIFMKFGQGANPTTKEGGTGLGLTICRELATMMGGNISFTSELGKGSVFTARVRQRVKPDNLPIYEAGSGSNISIDFLLWEENIYYGDSIERILKSLNIAVKRVFSASEAEGVLSSVKIDYAVVSAKFFKQAADIARRVAPATIPVKMLELGEADENDFSGKYTVLRKPVDVFSILAIIKEQNAKERFMGDNVGKFTTPDAKILIVDDNRVNLKVARALFETFKAQIVDVDSGAEAVELIKNGAKFDLIFMDHMMPGMDGIEASKRIWEIQGDNRTPIIALTANTGGEIENLFFDAGLSDFLAKPIVMKHLTYVMQKWIPRDMQVYVKEEHRAGRVRNRLGETAFDPKEGLNGLWSDEKLYLSVLNMYKEESGELIDEIAKLPPSEAKPLIERLASMSRSAGGKRLAGLFNELWHVSDMGTTDVYEEIFRNIKEEQKVLLAEIDKYIKQAQVASPDEI